MKRAFWLLAGWLWLCGAAFAQQERPVDPRPGCHSCLIKMKAESTEFGVPTLLAGTWLFTREDNFDNGAPDVDTTNWKLIDLPGSWTKVYEDGEPFRMGWFRTVVEFQPEQVGKEWVLLIPARLSRVEVYIDGNEVYRRPGNFNVERYFANQPIPIRFEAKTKQQTIAFRIDALTQDGVYELPFEIRRFSTLDSTLSWHQFRGGELRLLAGAVTFFFGLFFLTIYLKIRDRMYLTATLASLFATPYLVLPTDVMLRTFDPEPLMILQYVGLVCVFFFYLFCQHFDKFTPKLNWVFGVVAFGAAAVIASTAFAEVEEIDIARFGKARMVLFVANALMVLISIWHTFQGIRHKHPGSIVLFLGMVTFAALFFHDAFMVLGFIKSTGMVPLDNIVFLAAMIYVASSIFANTFSENKRLVTDLKSINDNLEHIVAERTAQLHEKTNDIQAMLQNMPQGVLTIVRDGTVHPEYARYLEQIYETAEIAGKPAMQLLFKGSSVGSDALSGIEAGFGAILGEDRMNFDFNTHVLVGEYELSLADGRTKSLELSWSPICDDGDVVEKLMVCVRDVTELKRLAAEAGAQKRELEMIGQLLAVSQEKFHEFVDSARDFIVENRGLIKDAATAESGMVAQLFRNMHTIKGNARTYGFLHLTNVVHEAEQAYDVLRKDADAVFDKDALLAQLQEVSDGLEEYATINDAKLGRKGPGRRGSVERYIMVRREQISDMLAHFEGVDLATGDSRTLADKLAKVRLGLQLIGTEPVGALVDGVVASLPSLAAELDKAAPAVIIKDNGIVVRNQIADLLRNVFMHLYRNSMDHGIEKPADRTGKGKPAAGTILLDVRLDAEYLAMHLSDDGKGLALGVIRKRGIERGLIAEGAAVSDEEVAQLIFAAGFSTAQQVTEVSGRGVGMDAVQDFVKRESGRIELRFTDTNAGADFRAFETVILLPARFGVATA